MTDDLFARIRACRLCLEAPEGPPLPHAPRPVVRGWPSARILIASQAPGTKVHATGLTFNDASGDRLRAWMAVDRQTFYDESRIAIVPMGFCFPGQDKNGSDLPPRRECAPRWREQVMAALPDIRLVLCIGQYAQSWHLRQMGLPWRASLTERVLNWREVYEAGREGQPRVLLLPHPSWRNTGWLKKNPWFEAELLPVLRAEVRALLQE